MSHEEPVTVVYSHMDLNNIITMQKNLPEYTLSNFYREERWQNRRFASKFVKFVFILKIGH